MIVVPSLSMWGKFELSGVSPDTAGVYRPTVFADGPSVFDHQNLPTEPVGLISLRFSGIKAGSELHIYYQDGSKGASIESAVDNQQVTVQRYVTGSPFNTVRVLIASLGFENLDFNIELPASDSSIPVFQRIDRAYRNPA